MGGFISKTAQWIAKESIVLDKAERAMVQVMRFRGAILAPKDTGDLASNGKIVKNPEGGRSVVFGDDNVPYARIQELGGVTGRNYQTMITGAHYLEQGGSSVAKEGPRKYVEISR